MSKRPLPKKRPDPKVGKRAKPKPKQASAARAPVAKPKKTGHSPAAQAIRYAAFVEAYITNGQNASAAASAAGATGGRLGNAGYKLLQRPEVQQLLAARAEKVAELAELNTANWAAELRGVLFSRIGDLFGPDGNLLPVRQLPPHVQAAVASVKVRTSANDQTIEYKFWNKPAALEITARHLGMFERDNAQQSDIRVRVELVG